jgi:CRP/FNR family cyclic AMP-dependent transcriptional regulator
MCTTHARVGFPGCDVNFKHLQPRHWTSRTDTVNYFTQFIADRMIEWRRRSAACHDRRMTPQDLFRLHPLFGALTDGETRELLKRALIKRIAAGEVVFRKDDPGDGLYGVLTGSVLIVVESPEGKELVLNKHDAGELFGEVALLDGEGRSAGAIAHEASELLFLGRDKFLAFLRPRPETMIRIIALLCARLRRATNLFEDSTFLNVPARLAKQVVALIEGHRPREDSRSAPTLSISQKELAQMLGVSREFVSKQLAIWREAGIIELGRRRLTVCNERALEQLITGGQRVPR